MIACIQLLRGNQQHSAPVIHDNIAPLLRSAHTQKQKTVSSSLVEGLAHLAFGLGLAASDTPDQPGIKPVGTSIRIILFMTRSHIVSWISHGGNAA
jgi:hypothetical protein